MTRRRSARHKGERPIAPRHFYRAYDSSHPVANMIATGTPWFLAWQFQQCLPDVKLARLTGIDPARIHALGGGAPVRRAELDALAAAYGVEPSDIIASLPGPHLLED